MRNPQKICNCHHKVCYLWLMESPMSGLTFVVEWQELVHDWLPNTRRHDKTESFLFLQPEQIGINRGRETSYTIINTTGVLTLHYTQCGVGLSISESSQEEVWIQLPTQSWPWSITVSQPNIHHSIAVSVNSGWGKRYNVCCPELLGRRVELKME